MSAPPLQPILSKLKALGKTVNGSGSQYSAQCPAHDDHRPSLSVGEGSPGGKVLVHCHAGCSVEEVLRALGLPTSALFPAASTPSPEPPAQRTVCATYEYLAADGEVSFRVVRTEPKGFFQQFLDENGRWVNGRGGRPTLLYNLPEVARQARAGGLVFVVEGEKDVESLRARGFVATTNPGGAGKWEEKFNRCLSGAHVVSISDNDEAGRRHVHQVAPSVHGTAASVKVLTLPNLPEKGDVSDWLASGGTAAGLQALVDSTPEWVPRVEPATEATSLVAPSGLVTTSAAALLTQVFAPIMFIVEHLITVGFALIAGKPKVGKSFFALQLATSLARGTRFLNEFPTTRGSVLYLALEDSFPRLQRRLHLTGGTAPENLHFATQVRDVDGGGLDDLKRWLDEHSDTKLVIVDTLGRVAPTTGRNDNAYAADVRFASKLQRVAFDREIAILAVHHSRKQAAEDPFETISGSNGLTGTADSLMLLSRSRRDDLASLMATGRDIEERELQIKLEAGRWTYLGSDGSIDLPELQRVLLEILNENPDGVSHRRLADLVREQRPDLRGANADNVKQRLYTLNQKGYVSQNQDGLWVRPSRVEPPTRTPPRGVEAGSLSLVPAAARPAARPLSLMDLQEIDLPARPGTPGTTPDTGSSPYAQVVETVPPAVPAPQERQERQERDPLDPGAPGSVTEGESAAPPPDPTTSRPWIRRRKWANEELTSPATIPADYRLPSARELAAQLNLERARKAAEDARLTAGTGEPPVAPVVAPAPATPTEPQAAPECTAPPDVDDFDPWEEAEPEDGDYLPEEDEDYSPYPDEDGPPEDEPRPDDEFVLEIQIDPKAPKGPRS